MKYVKAANAYCVTEKGAEVTDSRGKKKRGQKQHWFEFFHEAQAFERKLTAESESV